VGRAPVARNTANCLAGVASQEPRARAGAGGRPRRRSLPSSSRDVTVAPESGGRALALAPVLRSSGEVIHARRATLDGARIVTLRSATLSRPRSLGRGATRHHAFRARGHLSEGRNGLVENRRSDSWPELLNRAAVRFRDLRSSGQRGPRGCGSRSRCSSSCSRRSASSRRAPLPDAECHAIAADTAEPRAHSGSSTTSRSALWSCGSTVGPWRTRGGCCVCGGQPLCLGHARR
jgi:hypothetical protein